MTSFGPWRRVGAAALAVVLLGVLAFVAFRQGGFRFVYEGLRGYFEQEGFAADDAGNVTAGILQSLVDLFFLTGVLAMFGYVQQGFRKRADARLVIKTMFSAYQRFVRQLDALRSSEAEANQPLTLEQVGPSLFQLDQAMFEMSNTPLHFFSVLPEAANQEIATALDRVSQFRAFTNAARSPGSTAAPGRPRTVHIGSSTPKVASGVVLELHQSMRAFFIAIGGGGPLRRELDGALGEAMKRCAGTAHCFVTIGAAVPPAPTLVVSDAG